MKPERLVVSAATVIVLLFTALAITLAVTDEAQFSAAMFAIGIATGAVLLNVVALLLILRTRLGVAESELRRAKVDAEIVRLLASIDGRLAALPAPQARERE